MILVKILWEQKTIAANMQFIRIGNTRADCKQAEIKLRQGGSWISHIPSRQNFRRVCTSILSGLRWHRQSWVPGPFQSIDVLHLLRWHMHSHILPRHHSHFHSLASLLASPRPLYSELASLGRARQIPNPRRTRPRSRPDRTRTFWRARQLA